MNHLLHNGSSAYSHCFTNIFVCRSHACIADKPVIVKCVLAANHCDSEPVDADGLMRQLCSYTAGPFTYIVYENVKCMYSHADTFVFGCLTSFFNFLATLHDYLLACSSPGNGNYFQMCSYLSHQLCIAVSNLQAATLRSNVFIGKIVICFSLGKRV